MKRVFSGIQPTGNLHLGNYLGSAHNWLNLQNNHECIFGIMDLHSITIKQDPKLLKENILNLAINYLAFGIDPKKAIIFTQSHVSAHAELAWLLGTIAPIGWLSRMTQYKDKAGDKNNNLGLFSYPILMAADILLYQTDLVPTGKDQKQHLELTRDLATSFNENFKTDLLTIPEPLINGNYSKIMSLQDGNSKMSKSDISDLTRININDDPKLIEKKIKKAKTDTILGISYDKNRPEIYNLLNIFSYSEDKSPEEIVNKYQNSGFGDFKKDLAESLVTKLNPIQEKISNLKNNLDYVENILKDGRGRAEKIAEKNLEKIKKTIGLT
ncbi:MAG: tryptophanyl-tRNA synthetase [Ulvibacter sp.]|jgi:tryptophanyl-tRNA synthetase